MAVNLFKIIVNGTEYIYTDAEKWVDSKGRAVNAPQGVSVGNTKNSDGTYDVTVNKVAFSTIDKDTTVTLEDLNADDRQLYRLKLGTGYTSNEIYGGRQSVASSQSGGNTTLTITDINAGLLVNSGGTSITYGTPKSDSATVVISSLSSTATVASAIEVIGRTIILNNDALPSTNYNIKIGTNATDTYSLALGKPTSGDGNKISTYTAAGWSFSGSSAYYYSEDYTAGYYKNSKDETELLGRATIAAGTELFNVSGLSTSTTAAQLGDYFAVQKNQADNADAFVSLKSSGFEAIQAYGGDSAAITITDASGGGANYKFTLGSGVTDSATANIKSETLTSDYKYNNDSNDAYANLVSNTITVYDEKEAKYFSLSGLAAGKASTGAISIAAQGDGFVVTLGESALNKNNVYAFDSNTKVSFSSATGFTSSSLISDTTAASSTFSGHALTYTGASGKGTGYDFSQGSYVIYNASGSSYGGEKFTVSGLSSEDYVTITPSLTSAGKSFNIALSAGALSSTSLKVAAGASNALSYSLTYDGVAASNNAPASLAATFTYDADKNIYNYVDGYTPAYLKGNVASLAAGGSTTFTYTGATSHAAFALSGLTKGVFGTTSLNASDFFTVTEKTGSYSVAFTDAGVKALMRGASSGDVLKIVDKDSVATTYSMKNPQATSVVAAGFDSITSGGTANFTTKHRTSGWSAANETGGYSKAFTFYRAPNQDYAFSLSGLTGLTGSLSYAETGGISYIQGGTSYAFGSLNNGVLTLSRAFFDNSNLKSVTLIDDDAMDGKLYTLALGASMPVYGVSNMRDTVFKGTAGTGGLSDYEYISGGLSDGFGLYQVKDGLASLSAGTTTVTEYAGTPSSTFTIKGLTAGIGISAVLDYATINSETYNYYVKDGALKRGNYVLAENIALSTALTIDENVAISLGSFMISNASGSVFNISGGELIISGNGSITAGTTSTAIAVADGTLIVNGGNITGNKGYAIADTSSDKSSTIVVNGGTVNGIDVQNDSLIVAGGTVAGSTVTGGNAIKVAGGQIDVTGGTINGSSVGINIGGGSLNVFGGTITAGLSVASGNVNVLGGSIDKITAGANTVNIGKATIGSLSGSAFKVFADYDGNSYATFGNAKQTASTGSYSSFFTYSGSFSSILSGVKYPTFSTSSAVIVGASAGGYITLNSTALSGISTASLAAAGPYKGLALGNDVTAWKDTRPTDPTDPTVSEGWMLTGVSKAGDSSVNTATYHATNYLESWKLATNAQSVTRYAATGGASISVSGLSYLTNYDGINGTTLALAEGSLDGFFTVARNNETSVAGGASVSGYTLTVKSDSLLSALAEGEKLTFTFDDGKETFGASGFSVAFDSGITGSKLLVLNGNESSIKNYTHSATITGITADGFTYTAAGTSGYYNFEKATTASGSAILEHVETKGLEAFSLSGLKDSGFTSFSLSAVTGKTYDKIIYGIKSNATLQIGTLSLATAAGGGSYGYVLLSASAFNTVGKSQTITLTDLDMEDGVYYSLSQGTLTTRANSALAQALTASAATVAGHSNYTFTLGGSQAFYTITSLSDTSATTTYPGGTSGSQIVYTPQVGGQKFELKGLASGLTLLNGGFSIMSSGNTQVGSISVSNTKVVYGGSDSITATVTLTDVAAMGTGLTSGQSVAFSFKDSDSLDSVNYTFALSSVFNVGDKPANPDVEATFASVTTGGYSFTSPAYDNYTLSKGSDSYVYYAPETPETLTIKGFSAGLAASGAYSIGSAFTSGASGITTVTKGTDTLFTVERAGGSLNVMVYEGALSSTRQDITVTGTALSGLSFYGDLGKYGVLNTEGGFSTTAGGSFTYTADSFKDYYFVGTLSKTAHSIGATHYDGTGGQSFTFSGLSTGYGLTVAGFSSAISVTSASSTTAAGGYGVSSYTFTVGSVSFLNLIPQGQSLAVKVNGTDIVTASLSIASVISAETSGLARQRDRYVAVKEGLAPLQADGLATIVANGGGSFTYTASLTSYDWFNASGSVITHNPQVGGQQFSLSGVDSKFDQSYTYAIQDSHVIRAIDKSGTGTNLIQVSGASIYLTEAAFGSGSKITLTDGYDGASNAVVYKIAGTSSTGFLNKYDGKSVGAKFASLTGGDGGTYSFTASGINAGISIAATTVGGLSVTTAQFIAATGSQKFTITGLSAGMTFASSAFTYDKGTLVQFNSASAINVTGLSTTSINVMVYEGALSTGRSDISLTGGTENITYSLSLASGLLLQANGAPSLEVAGATSIAFNGQSSATWTANTYKDYYSLTADTLATHYNSSGGQSFLFSVVNASGSAQTDFAGKITVFTQSGALDSNNQYELNNIVFGLSKAALAGLDSNGDVLSVASLSSGAPFSGTYGFSFVGKTNDSVYSADAIITKKFGADAGFTSVAGGSYTFAASIGNYAWYENASDAHSITYHAKSGGESFSIKGLNTNLGALTYNSNGEIYSGKTLVGKIELASTSGTSVKTGNVYLTAAAFGSGSSITLTDLDSTDGISYALKLSSSVGTDYLMADGSLDSVATFKEQSTAGTYVYTASINGAHGAISTSGQATTLTYSSQTGGQAFSITGLASSLNASVDTSSNVISNNVIIGNVSLSGAKANFELKSPLALGVMGNNTTKTITLTDSDASDGVDYTLSLEKTAFNYGTEATQSITGSIKEEGSNTGTYDVQVGGIPAWSEALRPGTQYMYHAAKDATTYIVSGLKSGLASGNGSLSAAAISAVFGTNAVTVNAAVLPASVTTVQVLNNTSVGLGYDSVTIADESKVISADGKAASVSTYYVAPVYKPWTDDTNPSDGLTIYPSVGGQSFLLTGFDGRASYSGNQIKTTTNGTITADVSINESTGAIDQYTFTVSGRSALMPQLGTGTNTIIAITSTDTVPYALDISNAIAIGTGTVLGQATLAGTNHDYTGTGISEHAEVSLTSVGGLTTAYSYHQSIAPVAFRIQNLKSATLNLGSDVYVNEVWSGDTLSGVNISLTGGALAESVTSAINIASGDPRVNTASISFALVNAKSVEATVIKETLDGDAGNYFYQRSGTGKGYYVANDKRSVVYSPSVTGGQSFTLTGLSTGLGTLDSMPGGGLYAKGISASIGTFDGSNIAITSASALADKTVVLTDYVDAGENVNYALTIADSLLTVAGTSSPEEIVINIENNNRLTYTASVTAAHYNHSASAGTDTTTPGAINRQDIYTYVPAQSDGYDFYFDGGFDSDKYNRYDYSYSIKDGVIIAKNLTTSVDVNLATIAGGISGTITIGKDAFSSASTDPLYLTYTNVTSASAGYKLALGAGMDSVKSRDESFKETSSGVYSYKEAGNSDGYAVISYSGTGNHGGSAIEYTTQTGGNNFQISGLKGGMSLSVDDSGNIVDGAASVTIGTYTQSNTFNVVLNDSAFASLGSASFTVALGSVSNEYNSDENFGIGQFKFNIAGSLATGTAYASNGGSFADAVESGGTYSIIYKENAQDAYWYGTGRAVNGMKSFTYMPTRGASDLFRIGSFSASVTGNDFTVNSGNPFTSTAGSYAVNVADSLLPNADNTSIALTDLNVNDGFDFYFAVGAGQETLIYAGDSHPASVGAHFDGDVFTANYRSSYTSIGSGSQTLNYVKATGGESFSITGLGDGINLSLAGSSVYISGTQSQVGTLNISGGTGVLTLTDTAVLGSNLGNGQSVAIVLTDLNPADDIDYSLALGSAFNVGGKSVKQDFVINGSVAGSYIYNVGTLSHYTTNNASVAGSITSYTYYADTTSEQFTVNGLSAGLVPENSSLTGDSITAYFNVSGQSVYIQDPALVKTDGKTITFDGDTDGNGTAYSLVNPEERDTLDPNFAGTGSAIVYKDTVITAGFSGVAGTNATLTYASQTGGQSLFTVTGLSSAFNAASMSYTIQSGTVIAGTSTTIGTYADSIFTLNDTGLEGASSVSLNGDGYNLALSGVNTAPATTAAHWDNDSASGVSYFTASNDAYWNPVNPNKAYTFVAQAGGSAVFGIYGLNANADELNTASLAPVSISSGGYSVTLNKGFLKQNDGAQVSITGTGNALYFDGIDTNTADGYASLQLGKFNGSTYSIGAYSDQMIANVDGSLNAYTFRTGSETEYVFDISVNGGMDFSGSKFTPSLSGGGNSVIFTYTANSTSAAMLDKNAKTVYIYDGIFGGQGSKTVKLVTDSDLVIASGNLKTTRDSGNNEWSYFKTENIYYSTGKNTNTYFALTDDKTLTYVTNSGGDLFLLKGYPDSITPDVLNAGAISVASKDGAKYVFTINDKSLLADNVLGGLSVKVYEVGPYTNQAGLSLTVAFAVNDAIGNNNPEVINASYSSGVYTAIGTESYYMNISSGVGTLAVASLSYVTQVAGEPFTITGLDSLAALGSDSVSIVLGSNTLASIAFTGDKDSVGRYHGDAYVYLTPDAFGGKDGSKIIVSDKTADSINYGLSYGDGDAYLDKLGEFTPETFDRTDGTYNYSASTRAQGITLDKESITATGDYTATYSASVGYGSTFEITGLANGLTVVGGKALAGTATVGSIGSDVFTLTSLSALSTAAQDLGNTTTFTLTNTGTVNYSLSVGDDLAVKDASTINETLTGASGVFTYAAAHSSAYVTKVSDLSYTYGAEAKFDTFELSGNGLASGLSLANLSISGMIVTLLDEAVNASASAGDTINFTAIDGDGDGKYYTIAAPPERVTRDEYFVGNGVALNYIDKSTLEGWAGEGGSTATFTYHALSGAAALYSVYGLSSSLTSEEVIYSTSGAGVIADGTTIGLYGESTLTLNAAALTGASYVSLQGLSGYTLTLGSNVAQSAVTLQAASFSVGTTTYYSAAVSSYWSGGDNYYVFNVAQAPAAQFSLSGVHTAFEDSLIGGVSVAEDSTVVTINSGALSATNVTLTNLSTASYSLSLGANVAQSAADISGWTLDGTTASYMSGALSSYYTLNDSTLIAYNDSVAGASTVVLDGVATKVGLTLTEGVVGLTANNFGSSGVTVLTNVGNYSFSLASGTYNSSFTGTAADDSITNSGSNVSIDGGAGNDLVSLLNGTGTTVNAGNGSDTISVGAGITEFTVADFGTDDAIVGSFSALTTVDGGITDGNVTIKGITHVAGTSYSWSPGSANISYISTSTSGALLADNTITLVEAAGQSSTLFTVFGVSSSVGVSLNDSVVTLGQSALAAKVANDIVSLSGTGYSLTLDANVAQSAVTISPAGFNGTAIYSASALSAYWGALDTNAYILNDSTAGAAQFSIAGASALADSIVSGTTVTLGEANLAGASITLTNLSSASYALALDGDYAPTIIKAGFGSLSGGKATYYDEGTSDGYTKASDTLIAFEQGQGGAELFNVSNITSTDNVNYADGAITATNESGAKLTLTNLSSALTIGGFAEIESLNATNQTVAGTPGDAVASDSNLIVTTENATITIVDAAAQTVNFAGASASYTAAFDRITDITDADAKSVSLTSGFTNNYYGLHFSYGNGVTAVDATKAPATTFTLTGTKQSEDLKLTGALGATNNITGGSGNDTLKGGDGNDTLKGNAGNDLFVYTKGTDTIVDYTTGEDKISLTSALSSGSISGTDVVLTNADGLIIVKDAVNHSITTVLNGVETTTLFASATPSITGVPVDTTVQGSDLVVTFASGDIETFEGAAADVVTIDSGTGEQYTAAFDRITNITDSNAKAVTLTAGYTNTYYGLHQSYGKGVTAVDATKANATTLALTGSKQSDDLTLTGAANATNNITGGSGNDTLTGGGQNDTLKGNAGADVFVQSAGTDTIIDYTENEDTIQLISKLANTAADETNVTLTTADGNAIVVTNGVGQVIKTVDSLGAEAYTLYLPEAPTNASVSGADLIVTADKDYTFAGASAATVTVLTSDGGTYTAEKTRITDITDSDKKVTLTTDFTNSYYGLHQSYGKGVTAVDATNANTATLALTGSKQSDDLTLTGATNATNNITGGSGNDTLTGGGLGDTLKGNAGNDLFVQSAGNDTITDYTEGEDAIQLLSEETGRETVESDVVITTDDGTIRIVNGSGKAISIIGEDTVVSGTPVDSNAQGSDLVVTLSGGQTTTFAGAANDTITMTAGDHNYSVTADRITDYTDETDKAVTLTTGFDGSYYGLHQSYGKGVTAVDASKASATTLTLTGTKSTVAVSLTGANAAANSVIGGHADDTLSGGSQNDTLKGNAGADVFVQSGGNDVIVDYTAGEDVISLASALTSGTVNGSDVILTTEDGNTIQLTGGKGQTITTDYQGTTAETVFGGETVVSGAPVDVTVSGSDLIVTLADDTTTTFAGAANDTVTMSAGDHNYSVQADRITDYTDETDKAVTLAGGYTNTYYGLHQSYGKGVTAVDASKAGSATLSLTGFKSAADLSLTGAANGTNNITGGSGSDTLTGGTKNDSLKGNAGADVFVQTAGTDTILDYTAGEDVISLAGAITERAGDDTNVTLTTATGTLIVQGGVDQVITTVVDDKESTTLFLSSAPTDAYVDGDNLVVTTAKSTLTVGGATDTVTLYSGESRYTAAADRITDVTDTAAKAVTLTSDFDGNYYGLHYSYANGVTTVDASKAPATKFTLTGTKSTVDVALTGAGSATNSVIGGHGNDTLKGGDGNDTLKGNAGADLFIQSGGNDVIADYAEEDTIQLALAADSASSGNDVTFTNSKGTITVLNGSGLTINTTVVSDANLAVSDDELWGVTGTRDTFLFDGGNDTIHGYEEQDAINLGGYSLSDLVSGAPAVKDSSLVFEFDKQNSFTVVDAADKTIAFTDGTSYKRK